MTREEELQAARERKAKLYSRMKEAREIAQTTLDSGERRRQQERARILRDMYQEAGDEVARLEGRQRQEKKRPIRGDHIFDGDLVWADLAGMTWSQAEGMTWEDIQQARDGAATGRQSQLLTDLLNDSVQSCTDLQKTYIHECYTREKTMEEIAQARGVGKSAVSRGIKAGLAHVAHHVVARLTIARCLDDRGRFDYLKFVRSTKVLTERQTELLYLALTQDASYTMMAAYLGRNKSTVYRGLERAEERLAAVRVDFLPEVDVSRVKFRDWAGIGERELAQRLGLSRKFFYTTILRGQKIHGAPLLHYHILCLVRRGHSDEDAARMLGVSRALCRKVDRMYGPVSLEPSLLPAYRPDSVEHTAQAGSVLGALRDLTRGCDELIDRIDGPTLRKLQGVGSC